MTYEEWEEHYKPITNRVVGGTNTDMDEDYCIFETFDEDLAFVKAQHPDKIWTVLDCDGAMVISSGYHHVNRMYYIITEVARPSDVYVEILVSNGSYPYPVEWEGEGDNNGLVFGVEWRVYEDNLPNGEPDMDSHCDVVDIAWYATKEERDNELCE